MTETRLSQLETAVEHLQKENAELRTKLFGKKAQAVDRLTSMKEIMLHEMQSLNTRAMFLRLHHKILRIETQALARDGVPNSDFRDKRRSEEDLKKSVQGYLTYLPAGLPDKRENYITRKYVGMVRFVQKFLLKSLIGLGKSSRDIDNLDNLVDYDEYLKKSGIKEEDDDEEDNERYNFGVKSVIDDLDMKVDEEPVSQVGGKTKRRKHNRRNNKSKRTRRQ